MAGCHEPLGHTNARKVGVKCVCVPKKWCRKVNNKIIMDPAHDYAFIYASSASPTGYLKLAGPPKIKNYLEALGYVGPSAKLHMTVGELLA